ncbi:hypothetical protein V8F20_010538 [Naviculisporaceae sp. PSN 640]
MATTKPNTKTNNPFSPRWSSKCTITCHCGASRQTVELKLHLNSANNNKDEDNDKEEDEDDNRKPSYNKTARDQRDTHPKIDVTVCQCYGCRHATGQMMALWTEIWTPYAFREAAGRTDAEAEGEPEAEDGDINMNQHLRKYRVVERYLVGSSSGQNIEGTEKTAEEEGRKELEVTTDHYFCGTCGCHVFRRVSSKTKLAKGKEEGPAPLTAENTEDKEQEEEECKWELATGVIVEDCLRSWTSEDGQLPGPGDSVQSQIRVVGGIHLRFVKSAETKDGGLTAWLHPRDRDTDELFPSDKSREVEIEDEANTDGAGGEHEVSSSSRECRPGEHKEVDSHQQDDEKPNAKRLQATCHCENVSFSIIHPSTNFQTSMAPSSRYPDLLVSYADSPESSIANGTDAKWWLWVEHPTFGEKLLQASSYEGTRTLPPNTRYLAGTCACRSCRLTSGFEIQSWTFIPRGNIIMDLPVRGPLGSSEEEGRRHAVPLEFPHHVQGEEPEGDSNSKEKKEEEIIWPLKSYESSPGVVREFCPICGATVFWHDKWRPDLIDVSVGLLRFPGDVDMNWGNDLDTDAESEPDGSRHESWLFWWKGRVSFKEDATLDRVGWWSENAKRLVDELEEGMEKGRDEREKMYGRMVVGNETS